jgi:malate dehydrogenase
LLEPSDRLQLVGHGATKSEKKLLATRVDLLDAFDDERVDIEVVPKIADVDADIVVVASGVDVSNLSDRREMGFLNYEIFELIAEECARNVPDALFIVVSNPVELAVRVLSGKLDRRRVFGMGAQQDSLRFARAIAKDLSISRHGVHASVLGEHGQAMVPLWSSVKLLEPNSAAHDALGLLKEKSTAAPLQERVRALRGEVAKLIEADRIPDAYEAARRALPDARVFIEPFITWHSMHATPNATANATLQSITAALAGDRHVHGQVMLEGEFLDLNGVCGIPITLSRNGWRHQTPDGLTPAEIESIVQSVISINEFAAQVLARVNDSGDV